MCFDARLNRKPLRTFRDTPQFNLFIFSRIILRKTASHFCWKCFETILPQNGLPLCGSKRTC
ncbi:hypothetical protein FIB18_17395 [Brucella pecoris]|uniref:Uncharacterized protein n=1 Tax=Brucella pecoris TaxID=867683 RepID=A0A5C5CG99_9HYPH|nr:hypothetical protein FIB18_17395 [Brucella pecoris]